MTHSSGSFSFIQITDCHVGQENVPDGKALSEDLKIILERHGKEIDFVVATGDLTDLGKEKEFRAVEDVFKSIPLKIYPVIGDHDQRDGGDWDPANLKPVRYTQTFGPANYSFEHKGVRFISYDCIPGDQERRPSPWLVAELGRLGKDLPIVILSHRPLRGSFFSTLRELPIVACLSGHWHTSRLVDEGGIFFATCPSLSFGSVDFSPRGYRLFTFEYGVLGCKTFTLAGPALPDGRPDLKKNFPGKKEIHRHWSVPLGGRMVLGAPVIYGKNIFLTLMNETGRGRGVALALDSGVGKEIWRVETAAAFKNGPVIADGKLIGATVSGGIHAFQLENGIQLWDYQLGDPTERWLFSSPVNFGETVFAGPLMFFAAVNAKNGRELWARPDLFPKHSSDWISSPASPVADGERVYVGFLWTWGSIAALDRRTGKTLWHFEGRDHPVSPLVLDGKGALYLQSHTGHVLKIRTEDGALIWRSAKMNPWSPAKPLVWNDRVFVASGDGKVFALDEKDGRILWDWECRGGDLQGSHPYRRKGKALFSSPQIYQGSLLVGGTDGTLTRLDPENGKVLQSADLGIPITATPLVVNEKIFLPAGGKLLALEFPGF